MAEIPPFPPTAKTRISRLFMRDGVLKRSFGMDPRQSQMEMINLICNTWAHQKGALVEAATGTGKTFGYLLPAAEFIMHRRLHGGDPRIIISTASKNLQDQLSGKDLPIIQEIYPEITYFEWKGANNYLCVNRLARLIKKGKGEIEILQEARRLWNLRDTLLKLPVGRRGDIPYEISDTLWSEICGAAPCCSSQDDYPCYKRSAFFHAKRADILVLNHTFLAFMALYADMIHPALPSPEDTLLLFDEGHELTNQIRNAINHDFNVNHLFTLIRRIREDRKAAYKHQLQGICDALYECIGEEPVHVRPQTPLAVSLLHSLGQLMLSLASTIKEDVESAHYHELFLSEEDQAQAKDAYTSLFRNAFNLLTFLQDFPADRMLEVSQDPLNKRRVRVAFYPFDYTQELRHIYAFSKLPPLITSATLLGGSREQLCTRFALSEEIVDIVRVSGEFNYDETVRAFCFPEFKDVSDPTTLAYWLEHILPLSHGNALVLFTNYMVMNSTYELLVEWGQQQGYNMLIQTANEPIQALVKSMRETHNSVLFGNAALWTGIDIKGAHLSNLIITKLPFMPLDNFTEAYSAYLSKKGAHPFYDWMLPEMIIRFRQGIGRLKRDENDRGLLFIFDPRLVSSKYRNNLAGKMPIMPWHPVCSVDHLPPSQTIREWLRVNPPTALEHIPNPSDTDDIPF